MPRLSRPTETDPQKQRLARELLARQAEIRARTAHNGYFARLAYDAGIPVAEIAQTYSINLDSAYKLIRGVPDCYNQHDAGDTCTECGHVGGAA